MKDGKPEDAGKQDEDKQAKGANPGDPNNTGDTSGKQTNKGASNGGDDKGPKKVEFTKEQQEAVDRLVGDARKAGREKAEKEAEDKRKKDADEAEQKRLEDQKEWEKLANERKAKIDESDAKLADATKTIDELKATVEQLTGVVKKEVDVARKDLPEHITTLLDKLDPVAQLEWLAANEEAVKGSKGGQQRPPGTPPRPGKMSEPPKPGELGGSQEGIGFRL